MSIFQKLCYSEKGLTHPNKNDKTILHILNLQDYLLPKVHKQLYDVPGRPVISKCGFYTENISSFVDFHLQSLAQKVKSYIKDTNHFLRKIKELGQLLEGTILCTVDVVGLYPNIPHDEGFAFLKDFVDK